MAKPYSQDLRERMVRAVRAGQSRHVAACSFDVSASCVIKLMQQWQATGHCLPQKFGGHKRHALAEHEGKVRALGAPQPDPTIAELAKKLTALEIKVGRSAVGRCLQHLQLTFKKRLARPVCKRFYRERRTISLLQRIRPRVRASGQEGDPRVPVLIKLSASSAVF
jgi:transposase